GRFLEHTRVFYFHNDGVEDVYLSSADWMDRNFFGRVEVCFPVLDPELKQRVINEGLRTYLEDNTQAWQMGEDGQYVCRVPGRARPVTAQQVLLDLLARKTGS
ncbi:MAG: RNA degradosome polyphosphate kinase, partial [Burkholderiales bacterium]|nr:RNA degradosome polyphosphate kinase [Burkholderiales bacterium]